MSANDKPNTAVARTQGVRDENVRVANRTMPGNRAELPKGALRDGPAANQADQNRDQPVRPDGTLGKPLP